METMTDVEKKDVIIVGAGPAGLSASIYASRYKIDHVIIGSQPGGFMNETQIIENYPAFSSISGAELSIKMKEHVESLGAEIILEEVTEIEKIENGFKVKTFLGKKMEAKKILYAIGTKHRTLGIPGEKELTGKGISYCATCDGPFFKDKKVVVVGGGNSAGSAATILSQYASGVTVFYRKEKPPMLPSYLDELERNPKMELICCTNLKSINGGDKVESITLDNSYQNKEDFEVDGVFIEIGSDPKTELAEKVGVKLDKKGFIITNPDQSTSLEGFYAAGDITTNSNYFRQIIVAASEGAVAALAIFEAIKGK
jgi:thioredoxin reductase (NADPH)